METPIVIGNFVGGKFLKSKEHIESHNPATGEVLAVLPNSGDNEANAAVDAAKAAFPEWSSLETAKRAEYLNKIADALEAQSYEFAKAESMDQGKPLWQSQSLDVPRAIKNFRHFANTILCDSDKALHEPNNGILNYTVHSPVGVAVLILPWNFPLHLLTFKLAPALAYGNTVVVKPSEFTSLSTWMLSHILRDSGLPDGVVNVVFGYGSNLGESLIQHPDVRLISFTGSTKTGCHIAEVAAKTNKKISLEMGGKNAAIVFDDADILKCVPALIRGSFLNQGQICLSTSRIFVQRKLFLGFVEMFVKEAKSLKVGDPMDDTSFLGPLCSKTHMDKVKGYISLAKKDGVKFLVGIDEKLDLSVENRNGYFVQPTVLTDVSDDSPYMQEEIFGPVTCLVPFDSDEEVVKRVNATKYGLCASVWSRDVKRIHDVALKLEVGTVWCNCWLVRNLHMPFGGYKMSGMGREGTEDSREFFTTKKTVCLKYE